MRALEADVISPIRNRLRGLTPLRGNDSLPSRAVFDTPREGDR